MLKTSLYQLKYYIHYLDLLLFSTGFFHFVSPPLNASNLLFLNIKQWNSLDGNEVKVVMVVKWRYFMVVNLNACKMRNFQQFEVACLSKEKMSSVW